MLIDTLSHNQNMTLRTSATKSGASGSQNLSDMEVGHGFINMMLIVHVATHSRDCGPLQPTMHKEPPP